MAGIIKVTTRSGEEIIKGVELVKINDGYLFVYQRTPNFTIYGRNEVVKVETIETNGEKMPWD